MALMLQEIRSAFDGFLEDDDALLMSLLEDSHCEEYDFNDEQLNIVIRSLEAVINVNTMESHESTMEPAEFVSEVMNRDCGKLECSTFDDFEWNEMEMVLSSQSDDMYLYVKNGIEGMDEIMEFIDESSYSQNYYAADGPLEEHGYSL